MRISLIMLAAALVANVATAGPIERNFATISDPTVTIENKKGSVDVVGWDETGIRITGSVGNDITRVDIDDDEDSPDISVVSSKWGSNAAEAKLTVYVPRGASLDIETVSAPISVVGVSGALLELKTASGSIDVDGGFRTADIEGVSSSIRLQNATGDVTVENVSGKVEVHGNVDDLEIEVVSGGVTAEVSARTVAVESVSSTIRLIGHISDDVEAESVSGGIRFTGTLAPDGEMQLRVLSGGITVEFEEPAYGEYDLRTFSGSIDCNLEPINDLQRDGKRMEFEYGDGDRSIELESFSGSVSVR